MIEIPETGHYWLHRAHVPVALLVQSLSSQTQEGLALVDLEIRNGCIQQIQPSSVELPTEGTIIDLQHRLVFPCFADLHTHLDKGHTWERSPNPTGHFDDALTTIQSDRLAHWNFEDLYQRMEFGLRCAYAHGTRALRTHLDAIAPQGEVSFAVFRQLQKEWSDRIHLQAASLVTLDYFLTPDGEALADLVAESGGVLAGVAFPNPDLEAQVERVFDLAHERGLDLDFHVDESPDPASDALHEVAKVAQRHAFSGQIVCGHCCSLSLQTSEKAEAVIADVKGANIGVVSLPMCNIFLQDRNQEASKQLLQNLSGNFLAYFRDMPSRTPRWRGVTLLHELKQAGVPVAVANDNCRDAFHAYGDHDMVEVFRESSRIAHFDMPYGDWCRTVTMTPADLMGLPEVGRIGVGLPADLVVFKARYFSELLSRPQSDRIVLRNGISIDTTLPDYAELDHLIFKS
ncbi:MULTISPECIES: cytosine deaminase [unclassified Leptolyngbya]|uniref:cytosine deaminase n=1 Tax=unclassified Leptolyngbya TaxID=2650499 RepID=UPI00168A3A0C|nr:MULTISPECIES: cytosine deaminase [unclassified Leptolyngbya]MBD1914205.1 cytosine deaminase [Leptolyngbya sp. FACHB-8]MBD2157212.1 cytosine deaminase [Leptolyngbya sp. FACHB-16]